MALIAFPDGQEILIYPLSAKRWQVVRRPDVPVGPIDLKEIKLLCTFDSKKQAVAFAEGYQAATGYPIKCD